MRLQRGWIPWAVLLLLAGLGGWFFFTQFERVEVEEDTAPSSEVLDNEFMAVELLFQSMGVVTERRILAGELPPTDHVLVFLEEAATLGAWSSQELDTWIEAGGHLVYSPDLVRDFREEVERDSESTSGEDEEAIEEETDALLEGDGNWVDAEAIREMIGVESPAERPEPSPVETLELTRRASLEEELTMALEGTLLGELGIGVDIEFCPSVSEGQEVDVEMGGQSLAVVIRSCPFLDGGGATLATGLFPDGESAAVLRYAKGAGLVTMIADPYPLYNQPIGEADHAVFAWHLVAPSSHPPVGVVFVRPVDEHVPSLAALLLGRGWPVVASAALALLLFFWGRGARFGPLGEIRRTERRSLLEHVQATGTFLWRQRLAELLLDSSRQALDRAARRRIPNYGQADRGEQSQRLAERTGLAAEKIASALERRSIEDPAEFTRVMRTLESARRSL